LTWTQLCKLAQELPQVEQATSYGTPALKVRGKLLVRLRPEGDAVVFWLTSLDEQELLIELAPELYFVTDHYRGYPTVLARLRALRAREARTRLREAYLARAPRSLTKALRA